MMSRRSLDVSLKTLAPFTLSGAVAGARAALVLSPTIVAFGAVFGMIAATTGLSLVEAAMMSAIVCAGTAQFAALQLWSDPVSWVAVGMASVAMNSRYLLLGATLRGWFEGLSAAQAYVSLYFLYDGNWATATRDRAAGDNDAAHLVGGGVVMCLIWTLATIAGHMFGGFLGDPKRLGLDFLIIAFFASLGVSFWRGRGDVVSIIAAVVAAVVTEKLAPGPWYMMSGALAGCFAAMVTFDPTAKRNPEPSTHA
jgi:predicted branched-subunit amino acid permease